MLRKKVLLYTMIFSVFMYGVGCAEKETAGPVLENIVSDGFAKVTGAENVESYFEVMLGNLGNRLGADETVKVGVATDFIALAFAVSQAGDMESFKAGYDYFISVCKDLDWVNDTGAEQELDVYTYTMLTSLCLEAARAEAAGYEMPSSGIVSLGDKVVFSSKTMELLGVDDVNHKITRSDLVILVKYLSENVNRGTV